VSPWLVLGATLLLGVERACYVGIARAPARFRRVCDTPVVARLATPVSVVGVLFGAFKILQFAVFVGWCYVLGDGRLGIGQPGAGPLALAGVLVVGGQILNLGVFYRLGAVGVFFGDRLGREVPWCRDFPFSWVSHPQYVGTILTIWGGFLAVRFPHPDWYVLPVVETLYYALGAHLEAGPAAATRAGDTSKPPAARERPGSCRVLRAPWKERSQT
jgi:phosphatidyl-N-methylethanolamine N-methyltransferase